MKIISVTNQKGGCGKTITAVNLAAALSGLGKKTLLIDIDPQAHASCALGISAPDTNSSAYAIFETFLSSGALVDLASIIRQKNSNLWVIGSGIALSTMEQKLSNTKDAAFILSNTIKSQNLSRFDYIIIDTPPNLGFLTLNAIHAAKRVIVPIDISMFSLNGVTQIDQVLELAKSLGFDRPDVNFLITSLDSRSNFAKSFVQRAKERFKGKLLQTAIRSNIRLREAAELKKSIFEHDPSSNGAKDYLALAKEIAPEAKNERLEKASLATSSAVKPQTFFKLLAPQASSVYLVGSFNDWTVSHATQMKKLDNGTWVKIMSLPIGSYQYKFVVDGQWVEDPQNTLTETDGLGGKNSLMVIGANN